MELFTGFAWPVPLAFASAVSACRFEQGDVLYDHVAAYDADTASWGDALSGITCSIQVLDPPRGTRAAPSDAGGRRFDANWDSPIKVERTDYPDGRVAIEQSTQGRLFTCLWRGNASVLAIGGGQGTTDAGVAPAESADGRDGLVRPVVGRELHAALEEGLSGLRDACRSAGASPQDLVYAFVVDEASDASLAKYRAVSSVLASRLAVTSALLVPSDVFEAPTEFHPALKVCVCRFAERDDQVVRDLLKSVLYGPTRTDGSDTQEDAAPDRFRLERHGLLAPLEAS